MTRYRLCSHVEEFHCPECGRPVYYGEHAVEHEGDCYCSEHCAEAAEAAVFAPESVRGSHRVRNRLERCEEREPEQPAAPIRRPVAVPKRRGSFRQLSLFNA